MCRVSPVDHLDCICHDLTHVKATKCLASHFLKGKTAMKAASNGIDMT